MRQYSREKQAANNLQRTGLTVINQAQIPPNTSTVKSLGFDTMTFNKPIFGKSQPYNYSQNYPPQERYQPDTELNQQMQPYIMNRNDDINQPLYQSMELQRKPPTDMRSYDNNRKFVGQRNDMYDQLNSLAVGHNIAAKTPEQIVNEFKAYTLPKLRLKRFIKMQALMKGYHVRRFVIPRMRQRFRVYQIMVDEFLKNTIGDKFVPDIIMEVIAYNKQNQDLSLYSDKHRVFIKYMDDILFRVVKKLSREVVKEQTDYLVTSIMNKRYQDKPQAEKDPLKLLTLVFISRFIEKEVFVIAKETIRDMSLDYFKDLQYTQILKEVLIPNTVRFVVFEALDELIMERYLDEVINNLTKELSSYPLASHMYELIVAEQESYSLDKALQNYMYRMIGDVLLEHILLQLQDEQNFDRAIKPKLFDEYEQPTQQKSIRSIPRDTQQKSQESAPQDKSIRSIQKQPSQKSQRSNLKDEPQQDKSLLSIKPQEKSFIANQNEPTQKQIPAQQPQEPQAQPKPMAKPPAQAQTQKQIPAEQQAQQKSQAQTLRQIPAEIQDQPKSQAQTSNKPQTQPQAPLQPPPVQQNPRVSIQPQEKSFSSSQRDVKPQTQTQPTINQQNQAQTQKQVQLSAQPQEKPMAQTQQQIQPQAPQKSSVSIKPQ